MPLHQVAPCTICIFSMKWPGICPFWPVIVISLVIIINIVDIQEEVFLAGPLYIYLE